MIAVNSMQPSRAENEIEYDFDSSSDLEQMLDSAQKDGTTLNYAKKKKSPMSKSAKYLFGGMLIVCVGVAAFAMTSDTFAKNFESTHNQFTQYYYKSGNADLDDARSGKKFGDGKGYSSYNSGYKYKPSSSSSTTYSSSYSYPSSTYSSYSYSTPSTTVTTYDSNYGTTTTYHGRGGTIGGAIAGGVILVAAVVVAVVFGCCGSEEVAPVRHVTHVNHPPSSSGLGPLHHTQVQHELHGGHVHVHDHVDHFGGVHTTVSGTPALRHRAVTRQSAEAEGIQVRMLVHDFGEIYHNNGWHQYVDMPADASVVDFRRKVREEFRKCARTDTSMASAHVPRHECVAPGGRNPMRDERETDYVQQFLYEMYPGAARPEESNMHITCDIDGDLVQVRSGALNRVNGNGSLAIGSNTKCIIEVFAQDLNHSGIYARVRDHAANRIRLMERRGVMRIGRLRDIINDDAVNEIRRFHRRCAGRYDVMQQQTHYRRNREHFRVEIDFAF